MNWWEMLDYLSFILGLACISLAVFVLYRSGRSQMLKYIFSLFATAMGGWMISVAVADLSNNLYALVFWTKVATILSTIGVISFAAFAILFRKPNISHKCLLLLLLPVALIIFYVATFPSQEVYTADPFLNYNFDKPLGGVVNENYALYIPVLFLFIVSSIVILLKGRKKLPSKIRNQTYYLAAGTTVMMFSGILFDSVLPVLGVDYLYSLGPALAIVWVGATAYAIVRHELMDIRIIIQRGVIYSILFTTIAGIYLLLIFGLSSVVNFTDKTITLISGFLVVLLGIFGIPPLEKYFRQATDKFFFKDRYDYAQTLHELSAILNTSIEQADIVERTQELLAKSLRTDQVILSMGPIQSEIYLKIPLIINDRNIGTLAVGQKLSGDPWNSSDLKLLDTFAYQAAVALEKSRLYRELKEQELQEQQKLMMLDIAHNLQTPLTALQAELTLKQDSPGLTKSISQVSTFIYDLLALARLENTAQQNTFTTLDFSDIVNEVLEYVSVLAEQQEIRLAFDIEREVEIFGSKEELKTLVTNLLSNAIKFTKGKNPALVKVSLVKKEKTALFIVADTGTGIPQDKLPNIFQRFYRAIPESTPGSGLGLAICKAIAQRHQGTIAIESILDHGTTVTVTLPIAQDR